MFEPIRQRFVRCVALLQLCCTMCALVAVAVQARSASADGMMFQAEGITTDIRAEAQRAILWLRDGSWELSIYPRFVREAGSSAWVVPFPVRPTIVEGSADLFDELETITAPVIVEFCYDPHCCCDDDYYCDMTTSGGEGSADSVDASVEVWELGVVGGLDYVVLSSTDGESVATWLGDNGYNLPDVATPLLNTLAAEGSYFFAAKLPDDADADSPITPVTFQLPDLDDPLYPLRLTAAGVGADDTLKLVLWLVTPQSQIHSVADDFDPWVNYHGVLAYHPFVVHPMSCVDVESYDYYFFAYCIDFTAYGYELSRPFSEPLQEIVDEEYVVTRYAADLDAEAMANDMLFEPNEDPSLEIHSPEWDMISNIGATQTGACYSCPACPPNPDPEVEESYPERVENAPDAGSFPDVVTNADTGSRPSADSSAGASSAPGENSVGCNLASTKQPHGVFGLIWMLTALVFVVRRVTLNA